MKKLITLLSFVFCFTAVVQAQNSIPEVIKYQGSITDNNGVPITNQSIGIEIKIEKGNPATIIYTETHTTTTSASGTFNINIGEGTVSSGTFSAIDWTDDVHNIVISVDENGGTSYQLLGTSQLLAVPYALSAKNALRINGTLVDATTPTNGQVLAYDGTKWSPTDLTFATIDDNQTSTTTVWSSSEIQSQIQNEVSNISIDYDTQVTGKPTIPTIDDGQVSTTTLWSSDKIQTELGTVSIDYANITNTPTIPTDYVTLNTAQTISGIKKFTEPIDVESGNNFIEFYDLNGIEIGSINTSTLSSTATTYLEIETPSGYELLLKGGTYVKDEVEFEDDVLFKDEVDFFNDINFFNNNTKEADIYMNGTGIKIAPEPGKNISIDALILGATNDLYFALGSPSNEKIKFEEGAFSSRDLDIRLGTSNNGDLKIYGNSVEVVGGSFIDDGTTLSVPDYVFREDYKLLSLEEHADFMWKNNHLPKVTPARKINEGSYNMSERREQILEEVELAHIYIGQLHERVKTVESEKAWLIGGLLFSLLMSIIAIANTYRIGRRCQIKHTV
ncbi:MAG: hypothetical protein AB8G11_12725 [Saprospiraceae bacterium]